MERGDVCDAPIVDARQLSGQFTCCHIAVAELPVSPPSPAEDETIARKRQRVLSARRRRSHELGRYPALHHARGQDAVGLFRRNT